MKIIPILILNIVIYSNSFSQTLETAWQRSFGGTKQDVLESIVPTDDGGYLIGGWSNSGIYGEKTDSSRGNFDYWILKLNEQRDTIWQKTYGGIASDKLMDIVLCNDGGFLLAGSSSSDISSEKSENSFGGSDFWLLRIDSIGNIIWDKTIGGSGNDQLTGIINLYDNGYILGGTSASDSSGLKTDDSEGYADLWILKVDTIGNIIWQNTIGGDSLDILYSIHPTIDNGILLGGDTKSGLSGDKSTPLTGLWDFWMVKLDEFGNYEWDQSVGGDNQSGFGHAIQTLDGNYIIAGTSNCDTTGIKSEPAPNVSLWAVKFNETGDVLWDKTIGGGTGDFLTDIIPTSDGGSLIASYSDSDSEYDKSEKSLDENYWIIKLTLDGNLEWENTIVTHGNCRPTTIVEIGEDEFLIGGSEYDQFSKEKNTNSHGENDFYLVNFHNCEPLDTSVTVYYFHDDYVSDIKSNADDVNYQWYDCYDLMGLDIIKIIHPGKTEQYYDPSYYDAEYSWVSVRVSQDECEYFSDCYIIHNYFDDINENELMPINIYPNPAQNTIHIDTEKSVYIELINVNGDIVLKSDKTTISVEDLARGMYTIRVYDNAGVLIGINRVLLS